MSTNPSEIHVLGPVSEPEDTVREIFDQIGSEGLLLDLSAGQLLTPHTLEEQVTADQEFPDGFEWVNGQQYADVCAEGSRRAYVEWIARQADEPLVGNRSLKDLFTYDETSLWWFTPMAEKHPVGHPFRWLFYMIHVLAHCRQQGLDADEWHLWMPTEFGGRILEAECPEGAHVYTYTIQEQTEWGKSSALWATLRRVFGPMYLLLRRAGTLLLKAVRKTWRRWRDEQNRTETHWASSGTSTILVETEFPHSWVEKKEGEYERDIECVDRYFELAPWALQDHGYDVAWMPTLSGRQAEDKWEMWKERQTLPEVSDEMELRWRTVFRIIGTVWWWLLLYLWHFELRSAQTTWTYRNACLGVRVRDEVRWTISGALSTLEKIERYSSVGRSVDPDVVLYRDEFYEKGRCVAAALNDSATLIGIQHGLIGREHTVYQFHNSEVGPLDARSSDHVSHCPMPDYFASFGDRFVDLFNEWEGYPAKRVWPVGGLRHDSLLRKYRNLTSIEMQNHRSRLNLPPEEPVLLLCTGRRAQVEPWTRMVVKALRNLDWECTLAVKLHQYHGGETEARNAALDMGFERIQIYEEYVYPLIATSDVVIGSGSTILLEAGLLNTPAIALESRTEYRHYNFDGLALTATTTDELTKGVKKTIEGERKPQNVKAHLRNAGRKGAVECFVNCANQEGLL